MQEVFLEKQVNKTRQEFLNLLFDIGQYSCFTPSPHGWQVSSAPQKGDLFFCINALHSSQDLAPTKDWHSEYQPRRADANVICYRNFLIELDDIPLTDQIKYVTDKVPVSSIVYSGGKSYHFIISLAEPVSAPKYRELAKRLLKLLPKADRMCKNPSRLSRLPDVWRPDTDKKQELVDLRKRVPISELEPLLPKLPERKVVTQEQRAKYTPALLIEACIFPDDIMERMGLGGRNAFFFWLFNRMNDAEIPEQNRTKYVEQAYENLRDVSGFSIEEAYSAARIKQ